MRHTLPLHKALPEQPSVGTSVPCTPTNWPPLAQLELAHLLCPLYTQPLHNLPPLARLPLAHPSLTHPTHSTPIPCTTAHPLHTSPDVALSALAHPPLCNNTPLVALSALAHPQPCTTPHSQPPQPHSSQGHPTLPLPAFLPPLEAKWACPHRSLRPKPRPYTTKPRPLHSGHALTPPLARSLRPHGHAPLSWPRPSPPRRRPAALLRPRYKRRRGRRGCSGRGGGTR